MNKSATAFGLAILFVAVFLASAATVSLSHASETATISIDPTTQQFNSAGVGDKIQVNILVSNVQNLWSWDIGNLTFDPNVLNLTQISEGPFLEEATGPGSTMFIANNPASNASKGNIFEISDTLLATSSANGSGVIATLNFQVLSTNKTSQITFKQVTLNELVDNATNVAKIDCNAINAEISLGSVPKNTDNTWPLLVLLVLLFVFAAIILILLFSRRVKRSHKRSHR